MLVGLSVEGGAAGLGVGVGGACPAHDAAAPPAPGYHVSSARADPAACHSAVVGGIGTG